MNLNNNQPAIQNAKNEFHTTHVAPHKFPHSGNMRGFNYLMESSITYGNGNQTINNIQLFFRVPSHKIIAK